MISLLFSPRKAVTAFAAFACLSPMLPTAGLRAQTYGSPIVITAGGTYSGNWQSLDSNVPAVTIKTSQPVVIENANIRGAGNLVESAVGGMDLTIRNCNGYGLAPTIDNVAKGRFLTTYNAKNVIVENNYLENNSGIVVKEFTGNNTVAQTIKIRYNQAKNIDGRYRNGGQRAVQFVQLDKVRQVKNIEIAWNQVINEPGASAVEDNVSVYLSSGTSDSPILIHNNYIQGAYPTNLAADSYSGGGIMLGDGATYTRNPGTTSEVTFTPSYVRAYNNQVISTTNYGIAIGTGNNLEAYSNTLIASGYVTANGSSNYYLNSQNVGAYVWNSNNESSALFYNNSIRNNTIGWVRTEYVNGRNDTWFPNCTSTACTGNTALPNPITRQMEQDEFNKWKNKYCSNNVSVGPKKSPAVSLTAPANNATFAAGASVTINADASDPGGCVAKVEFYQGATKLGEDLSSPYSYTWSSVPAGSYSITAKAIDNANAATTSGAVNITVTGGTAATLYEAEDHYTAAVEAPTGTLGTVGVNAVHTHSGGASVRIYDNGDKFRINFNADQTTTYRLYVRLRSGGNANPSSYWPNGYIFRVNGTVQPFTGDNASIAPYESSYGGSYWGIMSSPLLSLNQGPQYVEIESNLSYAGVDYVEVRKTTAGARLGDAVAGAGQEVPVTVSPNPFADEVTVHFGRAQKGPVLVTIVDVLGKVHYQESRWMDEGASALKIGLSGRLPKPGVYFLKMAGADHKATEVKLVKQ